jgi:hypothetical protein
LRALALYRPDAVVICDGELGAGKSYRQSLIEREVLAVVRSTTGGVPKLVPKTVAPAYRWKIQRIYAPTRSAGSKPFAIADTERVSGKRFVEIGREVAQAYRSVKSSVQLRQSAVKNFYSVAFPEHAPSATLLEHGLTQILGKSTQPLEVRINRFCDSVAVQFSRPILQQADTLRALGFCHALLQDVDGAITKIYTFSFLDQVVLLRWKSDLEALRVLLQNIRVDFNLSERVLAERQLTFLTIDSIPGVEQNKNTQVHFTSVSQGWIVNEQVGRKFDLKYGEPYRLLSPAKSSYQLPQSQYGLQNSQYADQLSFVIVHQDGESPKNFQIRINVPVFFAPRFSVELATPLVRVMPAERIILTLTNNSRDGVIDRTLIADSLVRAEGREFRLLTKGSSFQDTLHLHWSDSIKEGSYLVPIRIAEFEVGNFVARKFRVTIDSGRTVGLITGISQSQTAEALRRLAVPFTTLALADVDKIAVSAIPSILIDRRSMTLIDGFNQQAASLKAYAERGGTLIVLAQEMTQWNETPLIDGLRLEQSSTLDPETRVATAAHASLFSYPNVIPLNDWNDWVFRRAYNKVVLPRNEKSIQSLAFNPNDRRPFVASALHGKGKIVYVDFDLQHQWVNLHAGAFKLLANLLAY